MLYLLLLEHQEDKDFFEVLYKKYSSGMYWAAYEILHKKEEAENVVHEAFMAIIDNLHKIKDKSCQEEWAYLVTIVRNKAYSFLRRENHFTWEVFEDIEAESVFLDNMEDNIHEQELYKTLARLILCMKYPFRDIVIMQYYEERSAAYMSEKLGITEENVRQMSRRARKQLEKMLNERGIFHAED
ncbi:MAG: sigma-70 family RNA polymerase sigma factor [Lachnospiraceae bacterium]